MGPLVTGIALILVEKALKLILNKVFDLDWGKMEKVKRFVLEAEELPLEGKSDDDGPDKDSWVRGKILKDPEFRGVKPHIIDWLIGAAVGLLKKKILK